MKTPSRVAVTLNTGNFNDDIVINFNSKSNASIPALGGIKSTKNRVINFSTN